MSNQTEEFSNYNFVVEYTDTFGGEANYAWVERRELYFKVPPSDLQLVRAAKKSLNLQNVKCNKTDHGEEIRLDVVGCALCVFISELIN